MGELNTSLFLALVTAFGACLASVLVWLPESRAEFKESILAIAPAWAAISVFPHLHTTWSFARKSVTGGAVGTLVGMFFCLFNEPEEPAVRYTGLVLSFPFVVFFGFCDGAVASPLRGIIFTPAALICFYLVFAFGPSDPQKAGRLGAEVVLSFAIAGASNIFVHFVFSLVFQRGASLAAWDVKRLWSCILDELANAAGGIITYLEAVPLLKEEMQHRLKGLQATIAAFDEAIAAWNAESFSPMVDKSSLLQFQTKLKTLASTQLAMLLATYQKPYSEACRNALWNPTDTEQQELRFKIVAACRHLSLSEFGKADRADTETAIAAALEAKRVASEAMETRVAKSASRDEAALRDGYDGLEATRTFFAQMALCELPLRLKELFQAASIVDIHGVTAVSIPRCCCLVSGAFRHDLVQLFNGSAYFPATGTESPSFCTRFLANLRHPLRLALVNHLGAFILMLLKDYKTPMAKYVLWALLPCNLCFLPTLGAVIIKAARRALGTVVGASLAFASLSLNNTNIPALITQLFLVCLAGKWFSFGGPLKGYAGLVVALTWCIVVLGQQELDDHDKIIELTTWRACMTISGVVFVVTASGIILPTFATRQVETSMGHTIGGGLKACVERLQSALSDQGSHEKSSAGFPMREAVAKAKAHLVNAEAEWFLVPRKVQILSGLHSQVEIVVEAVEICEAVADELARNNKAAQWCLNASDEWRQELAASLDKCFETLSVFASTLHSLLTGELKLSEAPECRKVRVRLETSFAAVRTFAFRQGAVAELMDDGLMFFWALVFALDNLLQECETLASIAELAEKTPESVVDEVKPFASPLCDDTLRKVGDTKSEKTQVPGSIET